MPSTIVHLYIANKIAPHLNINNLSQFYLGAISPDAVNPNDDAPASIRFPAHLRYPDITKWKESITNYYLTNSPLYANELDFFKGYCIHIISDIAWDELVEWRMFRHFKKSGIANKDFRKEKFKELFRLNSYLMGLSEWNEIESQLKKSHSIDINTVPSHLIDKYLSPVISGNYPKVLNEKCTTLSIRDINKTSKAVLDFWFQKISV